MIALCLFSCILFSTSLLCAVSPEENHWTLNVLTICKLCSSSALCVCAVHKYFFCKQAAYNYLKIVSSCAPFLPTWSELDCLILMHKTDCLVCVCADRNSLHITNEKVVFFSWLALINHRSAVTLVGRGMSWRLTVWNYLRLFIMSFLNIPLRI